MISDAAMSERRLPRRGVAQEGRWWSDAQKLETVKTFLMTGNLAMTARMLKIPEDTARRWAKSTWWVEIVDDLRTQDELLLSTRLQKIVAKSLDVVEDRLDNGDFVYDQKSGAMRRKPVALRDAHKVGLDLDAKRELILGRQAPRASEEQIDDKLLKLAKSFADIVNGKKNTSEAIDVEVRMAQDDGFPDEVYPHCGQDGFEEAGEETQNPVP